MSGYRCLLETDLNQICENYLSACRVSGTSVIPVVKANAYGTGAVEVSKALADAGAKLFAVAELGEALSVKNACGRDALSLGIIPEERIAEAIDNGIIFTAHDIAYAREINRIAEGRKARIHIKIDTGLHRLGFDEDNLIANADELFSLKNISIEGLYTHLALRNRESDEKQIEIFTRAAKNLKNAGHDFGMLHALDSIGMMRYPEYRFDAVRAGAWLYGFYHAAFGDEKLCPLAARLSARIMQVRNVKKGQYLGYDDSHPLSRDSVIATVAIGYADGIPRANNAGFAVVNGQRAPIAGLVCMDSLMLDVTDIPNVKSGDMAVFIGDGITPLEASKWYNVNRNEIIGRTSERVERVYIRK